MYDILCMSRLLEKKKKKELKSRGNESHFFLTTQSFPKAKILSKYQRWSRFTIFSYYTVNYQWCHRWSPSKAIPFCSLLPGCLASNSRTKFRQIDHYKIFNYHQVRLYHGLRTPNEGINQRYLKNWANVVDKICFGRT